MADVYRKGTKSVHRSILDGARFDHTPCNLDGGGTWGSVIPAGPRCSVCFGGLRARRRRLAWAGGAAGVLALVASVLAGQPNGGPVIPTASLPFASVTPGPLVPPTETPALTPAPTLPLETPRPTNFYVPRAPESTPRPTLRPAPSPTCIHPGKHLGVDPCKWPGNR